MKKKHYTLIALLVVSAGALYLWKKDNDAKKSNGFTGPDLNTGMRSSVGRRQ